MAASAATDHTREALNTVLSMKPSWCTAAADALHHRLDKRLPMCSQELSDIGALLSSAAGSAPCVPSHLRAPARAGTTCTHINTPIQRADQAGQFFCLSAQPAGDRRMKGQVGNELGNMGTAFRISHCFVPATAKISLSQPQRKMG